MVLTEVILQEKKHFVSCSGSPASLPKGSLSETDEKNRQHLRWQLDNDVSPNLDPLWKQERDFFGKPLTDFPNGREST